MKNEESTINTFHIFLYMLHINTYYMFDVIMNILIVYQSIIQLKYCLNYVVMVNQEGTNKVSSGCF